MIDGAIDSAGAAAIEPLLAYVAPQSSNRGAFERALSDANHASSNRERRAEAARDKERDDHRDDDNTQEASADCIAAPTASAPREEAKQADGDKESIADDFVQPTATTKAIEKSTAENPAVIDQTAQAANKADVAGSSSDETRVEVSKVSSEGSKESNGANGANAETLLPDASVAPVAGVQNQQAESAGDEGALEQALDSLETLNAAVADVKKKARRQVEESNGKDKPQRLTAQREVVDASVTVEQTAQSAERNVPIASGKTADGRVAAGQDRRELPGRGSKRNANAASVVESNVGPQGQGKEGPSASDVNAALTAANEVASVVDASATPAVSNPDVTVPVAAVADNSPRATVTSGEQRGHRDHRIPIAGTGGAREAPRGGGETEVQRVRLVQRVARAFQKLGDDGGDLRLRLSPPSLGSVKLEVSVRAGEMSARIEAETPAAKALILDSLPALRERLSTHDIKLMHFDVELAPDSQRNPQQFNGQQFNGQDGSPSSGGRSFGGAKQQAAMPSLASAEAVTRSTANGKLDVLI